MTKHVLLVILLLTVSVSTFCQQTNPAQSFSKEDYLKKSKSQKTGAKLLLGGGSMLAGAGIVIGFGDALNAIDNLFTPEQATNSNTGEVLFYTGLVAMAGSIPLFIASSRNKKNAFNMSTSFKMETRSIIQQSGLARTTYPALALKLSL